MGFSEEDILAQISRLPCSRKNLISRDDIAAFKTGATTYAGSDSLIENIHYRRAWLSPSDIAFKLFARNWSDFLCKGIKPEHALLNLNLKNESAAHEYLMPFLRELSRQMTSRGITLIGGDTARSGADVFTLTFLGSKGKFIPRSAKTIHEGDVVVQLGTVGGSDFARKRLQHKMPMAQRVMKFFRRPQLFDRLPPQARLKAAIDQSDSVHKSLTILSRQNHLQLAIDTENIQLPRGVKLSPPEILAAAEDLAVFGIAGKATPAFRVIGRVESIRVKRPGVVYRHRGKAVSPNIDGYEHFYAQRR